MGGGGNTQKRDPLWPPDKLHMQDLVYRTMSDQSQDPSGYSDEYSKKTIQGNKKQVGNLMDSLSRLGILDQLSPRGVVPRMPYRPIDESQDFSF